MPRLLVLLVLLAVPGAFAQDAVSPVAVEAALSHLRAESARAGAAPEFAVSSAHESARSGLTHVYVQQQLGGIDVAGALVSVAVARGRVVHAAGELVAGGAAANKTLVLSADAALVRAAALVGADRPAALRTASSGTPDRAAVFGSLAGHDRTARLVYASTPDGLRLAWEVQLPTRRPDHLWLLTVDAETGAELARQDLMVHDTFALPEPNYAPVRGGSLFLPAPRAAHAHQAGSYLVYPMPLESPGHAATAPPADARTAVSDPADAVASPFGWHDTDGVAGAEYTTTRGNNAHAYLDRDDDEAPDGPLPDGGASLTFAPALDLTQAPSTYADASIVNLFYWSNVIHDVMVQYGFDESSGNFQATNYSGQGSGGDAVDAEVQSGADICNEANPCVNNANFATPSDGSRPRMQMYVGNGSAAGLDGSFDNGVVVHEYGHGISNRLTGGRFAAGCLGNAEQMGEGWSDWYALMLTMTADDTATSSRGIGTYLFGQSADGPGIRPSPYSTSFSTNSYTYGDTRTLSGSHAIGFVWATALWEMTWDLIDAHGFDADLYDADGAAGNQIAMNLVTEGLKLQPCSPGFVDGRDAILAADAALYPDAAAPGRGVHYALLWQAFARRGLGSSADQGSSGATNDNVEAFDLPLPAAEVALSSNALALTLAGGETATRTLSVANLAAPGSADLDYSVSVQNVAGGAARRAAPSGTVHTRRAPIRQVVTPVTSSAPVGMPPPAPADARLASCVDGQTDGQAGYSNIYGATVDLGQSFTAACTGHVTSVTVRPYVASGSTTWAGTLYLYEGAGTGGSVLASAPAGATTSGIGSTTIALDTPELTAGQTYTWFLDVTTGAVSLLWQDADAYAGGVQYLAGDGTPGSAGPSSARDMTFSLSYGAPDVWLDLSATAGSVAPGASDALTVTVDASDSAGAPLADGTYTADLVFATSDPAAATVTVPVTLTVGADATAHRLNAPGIYVLAPPVAGFTVDDLAAFNMVRDIDGYALTGRAPNLLTEVDGDARWSVGAGAGDELPIGRGFRWQLAGLATDLGSGSVGHPLPMTLSHSAPNTADVTLDLRTDGAAINVFGNPFGVPLDVSGIAGWPNGTKVSGNIFLWDPAARRWVYDAGVTEIEPWTAFFVRTRPGRTGTLTIPASAAVTGAPAPAAADRPGELRFELDGSTPEGAPLGDAALALTVGEAATAEPKLRPLSEAYVAASFVADDALRAIEALGPDAASVELPIAVSAVGAASELVLRWDAPTDLPPAWRLALVDRATGDVADLSRAGSYTFQTRTLPALDEVGPSAMLALSDATERFALRVDTGDGAFADDGPELALGASFPNPARGAARVPFTLSQAGPVRLSVLDALGREVAVLAQGELAEGEHTAPLGAARLAAGVYVLRLEAGGRVLTQRATVVR